MTLPLNLSVTLHVTFILAAEHPISGGSTDKKYSPVWGGNRRINLLATLSTVRMEGKEVSTAPLQSYYLTSLLCKVIVYCYVLL